LRFRRRWYLARHYLSGHGLEIGALHLPLPVPHGVRVRYVDRLGVPELRKQYLDLRDQQLVSVDIVDDGERLDTIPDESEDFVIANHLIEHAEDPIVAIENWLRVLRPGGVLYMAVPHREQTFDRDRPTTPLGHLIRDYEEGPEWSRRAHFEEWVRLVHKSPEHRAARDVEHLLDINYSIHFHVWTEIEFMELLLYLKRHLGSPFSLEVFQQNEIEFILILRKVGRILASDREPVPVPGTAGPGKQPAS
jgi:SAM-dependent methyltransferase